jgi:hypothetical protein
MPIELNQLTDNLTRLGLRRMHELITEGVDQAAHQELSYTEFLFRLTEEELRVRSRNDHSEATRPGPLSVPAHAGAV